MSKALSLIQRDSFFDDDFFKDAWTDFDSAIQTILDKFDNKGLKIDTGSRNQCRDVYQTIRSSKIDDDIYASQALQVAEQDGRFSCVMDVKDFNPGDLQVKVVEDRVVVEGKYEKKSEDGSSMSSKSFYKEFTMPPSANLDLVSTALSKDGVLTIRAPKKEGGAVVPSSDGTVSSQVKSSSSSVQQSSSSVQQSSSSVQQSSSSIQQSSSSVQQSSSSNVSQSTSSSVSSVKKQSISSSSTFSSSTSSSVSKSVSSNVSSSKTSSLSAVEDVAKDVSDRLVFTHESVNLKLPEK